MMPSIVLVGTGNVAHHLHSVLGEQVIQVFGRNAKALDKFSAHVNTTSALHEIKEADLYLLAVSDAAINEVSKQLPTNGLVAHTSGSVAMSAIQATRKGVFYPLQTFTDGKELEFDTIPICVEAENEEDYNLLKTLADSVSQSVHEISSAQRKTLHLAAVFANNFSNHVFQISKEICENDGIDFDLLKPLIQETVHKIQFLNPLEAQTGPAKRNDIQTMQGHLDQLENSFHKKIYQILSESIRKSYE